MGRPFGHHHPIPPSAEALVKLGCPPGLICPLYGAEGVCVAVFSGAFSGTGTAVPCLTRNGKKGVTSNGIFSDAEFSATGFVLINSSRLLQGSTFTRPPRGKAAI